MKKLIVVFLWLTALQLPGQKVKVVSSQPGTTINILISEMKRDPLVSLTPNVNTGSFFNASSSDIQEPILKPTLSTAISHTFNSRIWGMPGPFDSELKNRYYKIFEDQIIPLDTLRLGIDSGYIKPKFEETLFLLEKDGYNTTTVLLDRRQFRASHNQITFLKLEPYPLKTGLGFFLSDIKALSINPEYNLKSYQSYNDFIKKINPETFKVDYNKEHSVNISFYDCFKYLYVNDLIKSNNEQVADTFSIDILTQKLVEHRYDRYIEVEVTCEINFYKKMLENDLYIDNLVKTASYTSISCTSFDLSRYSRMDNRLSLINALEKVMIKLLDDIQSKKLKVTEPASEH